MPRRVEDIVRSDRRTIREAQQDRPSASRKPAKASPSRSEAEERVPLRRIKLTPPPPARAPRQRKPSSGGGRRLWLIISGAVIVLVASTAVISSVYFSRASFSIVPITVPVAVNNSTIVATGTTTAGYLKYDIGKYSGVASTTVPAIDGAYSSSKAAGSITLYNSYAAEGQRLLAGTRLANEYGFVYRLPSSVFIPGYKRSGSSIIPGTLRAQIVADASGAQYNMKRSDGTGELRIVAYKGGPRYETIFAKLYSDISGGYEGTKKTVDPKILASTTADLQAALKKALLNQAMASVPSGYVTYDTAYSTSFAAPLVGGSTPKTAVVTVSGTLYNVLFKKSDLVAKLAGPQNIERFGKGSFSTPGIESLRFLITNPDTFKPAKMSTLIARLNGTMSIKGTIPVKELKDKLAGKTLSETREVFASYSSVIDVGKSSGELFPSWASRVPNDEDRISIEVKD